uniref:Exocyst complex component Sec6 n=1 Tax=Leptobrachium leishanense TaxID=445787 RepID=A0A8C5PSI1_9ANUR
MENKELQSPSKATGPWSRQNSTQDVPETSPVKKGTFLKNISIRMSKNKDTQGPVSPEKKEEAIADDAVPEVELLSVMEINGLINEKLFERAFQGIIVMEENLMEEHKSGVYKREVKYKQIARDVDMLYDSLFKQMASVVKNSLVQEPVNEQMLASVVSIISKEAKRDPNVPAEPKPEIPLLGISRKWKARWKGVIDESATESVGSVPLTPKTGSPWLADYLESLQTNIVKNLLKVKNSLEPLYPNEYDVFGTYVSSFHNALSSHLSKELLPHIVTFSQRYALLNWILNVYTSDSFMGHPDFHQDINVDRLSLLDEECLHKLKSDYQSALRETIKIYLTNILGKEKEQWNGNVEPGEDILKDSSNSYIYMDIEEITGKHVRDSTKLSKDLETPVFHICMVECTAFTKSLVSEFTSFFKDQFTGLFVTHLVIYVNSFIKLRNNPNQSDEEPCRQAVTCLDNAIADLKKHFLKLYQIDTQPYFKRLLTKKWLSESSEFKAIKSTTERCRHLKYIISPHEKDFVNGVYKCLVKGYLTEIMKRKMQLKRGKRKKASQLMNQQGSVLKSLGQDQGSDLIYLFSAITCISDIICLSEKKDIQEKLEVLYQKYPDISDEHVYSIFYLQGIRRSKKNILMNYFRELQRTQSQPHSDQSLFSEIENSTNTTCF